MSDRRIEIYNYHAAISPNIVTSVQNSMDEYFTERALELLEYMLKKDAVPCVMTDGKGHEVAGFSVDRGRFVTKEQLFENFL